MAEPTPLSDDPAKLVADLREDALVWRLSIYGGGVSTLAGALAGSLVPLGHPWIVFLLVEFVLCTIFGLRIGAYVGRLGDDV